MKIKIVLDNCFQGMVSGWATRFMGLITQLYERHELFIFAPGETSLLQEYFPKAFICPSTSSESIVPKFTLAKFVISLVFPNKRSLFLPGWQFYPEFYKIVNNDKKEYDMLVYFGLSSYVYYHNSSLQVQAICDVCDSLIRLNKSQARISKDLKTKIVSIIDLYYIKKIKRKYIKKDLMVSAITNLDTRYVKSILPKNNVVTIPNGVASPNYPIDKQLENNKFDSNEILFCGSLNYEPNIYAVIYILKELWPILCDKYPSLTLRFAGRNPTPELLNEIKNSERVKIYKNVGDIFDQYKVAKIFLSPMFTGGGMKNKILEALISGTPVITNREAIAGIDMESGVHGFLGETTAELIRSVDVILGYDKSTYSKMMYSCEELGKKYSWGASGSKLNSLICTSKYR